MLELRAFNAVLGSSLTNPKISGAIADLNRSPSARRAAANSSPQPSQGVNLNRASRSLQRQLLLLLHDDRAVAQRLFTQASLRYPGETPNWYAEKVIYDLERDRGAR